MVALSEALLETKDLTKIYSSGSIFRRRMVKAVDCVSFTIPEEKAMITTLAGESGSGKTTLGRLLLSLEIPTSGEILYKGVNIRKLSGEEFRRYRKEVQAIFQDPYSAFNPFYPVRHILSTPLKKFRIATSTQDEMKIIDDALEAVNLDHTIVEKYPHELSGGERQRVMIARALMQHPKLIIADEPVSMIDMSLRAGILNSILELKKRFGISFVYITHDLSTSYYLSDRIMVMYRGSVVEYGDISAVVKNPAHPYLKHLMNAIPIPDPKRRWTDRATLLTEKITYRTGEMGCKYYERCPERTERCLNERPPTVQVERDHYILCHSTN